jgi:hypothetical protein
LHSYSQVVVIEVGWCDEFHREFGYGKFQGGA